jgi:hypothetical protein
VLLENSPSNLPASEKPFSHFISAPTLTRGAFADGCAPLTV